MRTKCIPNTRSRTEFYRDTKFIVRAFLHALMLGHLNSLFDLKSLNPLGLRDHEKVGTVG